MPKKPKASLIINAGLWRDAVTPAQSALTARLLTVSIVEVNGFTQVAQIPESGNKAFAIKLARDTEKHARRKLLELLIQTAAHQLAELTTEPVKRVKVGK